MNVGRKGHTVPAEASTVASGQFGRLAPPPEGHLYVRDAAAASALAVQKQVKLFELLGQEVPEHLAQLAADLEEVSDGDDVVMVDSVTGETVDVDVVDHDAGEDLPEGASRAWQTSPEPEAAEPEPEPEPEAEDLENFTVAELKEQLDTLGVEYDAHARKAELIELVKQAEG